MSSFGKSASKAMKAVIYCRVSTKEQTQNLSLPTQRRACEQYCDRHGLEVVRVFVEEGESAKTTERPEFQKLLTFCREHKAQVQHVVVYSINRFARNSYDHAIVSAVLKQYGVTLRSATEPITEDSTGKLMQNMLAAIAQFDNDVRAERTIVGMKAALETGRWTFHPPLGYRRRPDATGGPTVAPDPERAPLVRKAFDLCATGLYTRRQVLHTVSNLGLRTLKGKKVSPQTFGQMLRNPIYAGWLTVPSWGGERRVGNFQPLVSDEVFERVQAVLDGRKPPITPHTRNHPDFPLRRFVRCGRCETPLTGSWSTGRSRRYPYYHCRRAGCRAVTVPKSELEQNFVAYLGGLAPKREYMNLFREIVLDTWKQKEAEAIEASKVLTQRLEQLRARKDSLVEAFIYRKAIDQATYAEQKDKLNEEIALAEMAAHEARLDELDVEGVLAFAEHVLLDAARLWMESSLDKKQRLQQVLFPRGVTYADGEFGTAETSLIFRMLRVVQPADESEASPAGFEPTLPA